MLHGFALSILVPDTRYAAVSDWIDGHHLRARVVYYRVPQPSSTRPVPAHFGPGTLAAKLEIKDTPFAGWLEHELTRRADHECVETMAEFRRLPRAITKAGQIKEQRRAAREGRPVPHRRPQPPTCSAGPTSASSTRCWPRQRR